LDNEERELVGCRCRRPRQASERGAEAVGLGAEGAERGEDEKETTTWLAIGLDFGLSGIANMDFNIFFFKTNNIHLDRFYRLTENWWL
jgi:hypothetical protein